MKRTSRILSYLSAFLSGLTLIRLTKALGVLAGVLAIPKLLAGALAPFLAIMGGLGGVIGLARRDRAAALAGLFGAAVAVRHVVKITAPHDAFDQAFGPDWRSRIPPELQARMLPRRCTLPMPEPPEAPWQRDLAFGTWPETGEPLLCDIWQPPGDVPHTGLAVIFLHAGAWHYGKKDFFVRRFFRHLAGQGHVIMDVAYTLAPKARLCGMVGDVKRAIAWVKANAADYGVNPERIVLMGGSAGGHLALLAAYTPNVSTFQPEEVEADTSVRAVVSYYGITDLTEIYRYWKPEGVVGGEAAFWFLNKIGAAMKPVFYKTGLLPPYGEWVAFEEWLPHLLGGTPEEVPELYELGSPVTRVGLHCPPTLLLHGAHDFGVKVEQARRLHQALRDAGVTSVYIEYPDSEHGFDLFFRQWSPAAQAATCDTERFLALMV